MSVLRCGLLPLNEAEICHLGFPRHKELFKICLEKVGWYVSDDHLCPWLCRKSQWFRAHDFPGIEPLPPQEMQPVRSIPGYEYDPVADRYFRIGSGIRPQKVLSRSLRGLPKEIQNFKKQGNRWIPQSFCGFSARMQELTTQTKSFLKEPKIVKHQSPVTWSHTREDIGISATSDQTLSLMYNMAFCWLTGI